MNRYVGTMNATPDSRTPRRLTSVIMARITRQSDSVYGWSAGKRRDQRPDPRRDADGHDQHVVEQERRRGKQAGVVPRFSLATVYDPPPCGYAAIVWRYEK